MVVLRYDGTPSSVGLGTQVTDAPRRLSGCTQALPARSLRGTRVCEEALLRVQRTAMLVLPTWSPWFCRRSGHGA
jgi:hypothetical protein